MNKLEINISKNFNVLWQKKDKIALALSGGVDSIALFYLLVTKYKNTYKELVVFHINHGLREESLEEAIFVESFVKNYNVKFYKKELNMIARTRKNHISEEMQARELRYKAFSELAKKENVTILLTAHHKNDLVENVVMRLLSGRSIDYNLAIDEKTTINGLMIMRPLLDILKIELEQYAQSNNLKYYVDKTNFDIDYTRNYIRQKIIPAIDEMNCGAFDNLLNFAKYYKNINSALKNSTIEQIDDFIISKSSTKVELIAKKLLKLSNEEIYFIFKKIIDEFGITIKQKAIFTAIADLKANFGNKSYDLKKNLKIVSEYERICIHKIEKKCYNNEIELKIEKVRLEEQYTFYDSKFFITASCECNELGFNKSDLPLMVTLRKDGDIIQRGNITKKLSRLFIDEKIPKSLRDTLPIVRNNEGKIIGIIGLTTSNKKEKYDYYIKMKG